jgi:hypothetical protein
LTPEQAELLKKMELQRKELINIANFIANKNLKIKLGQVRTKHLFVIYCFPLKIQKVDKVYLESLVIKDIAELIDPDNWLAPISLEAFKAKLTSLKGTDENAEIEDCEQSLFASTKGLEPEGCLFHCKSWRFYRSSSLSFFNKLK